MVCRERHASLLIPFRALLQEAGGDRGGDAALVGGLRAARVGL